MARLRFLTVLGYDCADTGYRLAALPRPGETVIALSVTGDLGGKGLNQAVAAARTGIVPRFIAPVGRDAVADRIGAALSREGIDARDLIRRDGASDSSVILIDRDGENAIVSDTTQAEGTSFGEVAQRLRLTQVHLLLLQGNLSQATTLAAVVAARAAGAAVALNAAPLRDWLRHPEVDILIANRGEAAEIAGLPVTTSPDVILAALSPPVVAITLGAGGCVLRDHFETIHIAAPTVTVRDSAGAGDVFAGVFMAEWLLTGNSIAAARLAVMAASTKVARPGTLSAFPTRSEIDQLRQSLGREPGKSRSTPP